VPKVYAFLGFVGLYFFFIFFNFGGQILTNVAGFVIPGYYSMEALFSASKVDDTQWLTVRIPGYSMAVFSLMILSTGLRSPS
jgi:receptor expression-enhancing protein 5/6